LGEWAARYLPAKVAEGTAPLAPVSAMHRWLCAQLDALTKSRGARLNVLAPRASAKTTWGTFAYPLRAALHGQERFIVLTSDTSGQAHDFLADIQRQLEDNPALERDYPQAFGPGPIWRKDRIRLRNGVEIGAYGTGDKIRGRKAGGVHRPSLIIVDDPQNKEHIVSPLQRARSLEWLFKDVCNAGDPETNILVMGTALHRDCIVCTLQRTPGWRSQVFKSVVEWPERMDLWAEWQTTLQDYDDPDREAKARRFYEANAKAMHQGAGVLWEQREDLYSLMLLRASVGTAAFASEKQNDPVNPELCEWGPEYFDYPGFRFERWPDAYLVRVLALDPSKGKDADVGDYSAYVRYGVDPRTGVEYVEADLRRRPTDVIVGDGVEHLRQFKPEGFAIEINQYQELLCVEFERAGKAAHVPMPIYGLNNMVNKEVRIRRLGPQLAQRKLRFKSQSPGTELLIQQLRDFPTGEHDDGPDTLEQARRLAIEIWNGRQRANQRPTRLVVT
jgi:predicted phage terminase large subunit-like protein